MTRHTRILTVASILVVTLFAVLGAGHSASAATAPRFKVDPLWPTIPAGYVLGQVAGVAVDANDHVWIVQRPASLTSSELKCCKALPPVAEFGSDGKYLGGWGWETGGKYEAPLVEHGLYIDYKGNFWTGAGNGGGGISTKENFILKFTRDGKFLLQIGHRGQSKGSNDTANLNNATDFSVYPKTNEVFVADGYINRRVIVFDADTGAYKRHWGAYGNKPDDKAPREWNWGGASGESGGEVLPPPSFYTGPGSQQFNMVHGIGVSRDGLVYVADRHNNRIQVFTINGKFIKERFVARDTKLYGSVLAIAFSADPQQRFIYVPDAGNGKVHVLDRQTLDIVDEWGQWGRYPGQFEAVHNVAVDSKGNLYTGEVLDGRRVQKFVFQGVK